MMKKINYLVCLMFIFLFLTGCVSLEGIKDKTTPTIKEKNLSPSKICYNETVIEYKTEIFHNGKSIMYGKEIPDLLKVSVETAPGGEKNDKYSIKIVNMLPADITLNFTYDRKSKWYGQYEKNVNIVKTIKAKQTISFEDPQFAMNSGLPSIGDAKIENLDYKFIKPNIITSTRNKVSKVKQVCN